MATAPLVVTREDGRSWSFDAVTRRSAGPRGRTTKHPVESPVSITDHVFRDPDSQPVTVTVTHSPFSGRLYKQPTGKERVAGAIAFLEGCWGQLLTLTFPDEEYEDYVLVGEPREYPAFGAVKFNLEFEEIVIVSSQTVEIPVTQAAASASAGLASEVDGGEQSGSDPTTTAAEEAVTESWLYQIIYGEEQEEEEA